MAKPKEEKTSDGKLLHYSVGAIIRRDDKYLLIDRVNPPHGFAALAGHVDVGEDAAHSLKREVREESGLIVEKHRLLEEGDVFDVQCVYGVSDHHWYIFDCQVSGEMKAESEEAKSIGWYTPEEIKNLYLEPSWDYWFKKLEII